MTDRIDMLVEGQKYMVARALAMILSAIGTILFANVLGAGGLGEFYIYIVVAALCIKPASGVAVAVERAVSDHTTTDDGTSVSTGLLIGLLLGCVVAAVGWLLYRGTFSAGIHDYWIPLEQQLLLITLVPSWSLYEVASRAFSGAGHPGDSTIIDATRGGIETVVQIVLVVWGLGVTGLLAGATLATAAFVPIYLSQGAVTIATPSLSAGRRLLSFAKYSSVTRLAERVHRSGDVLLIGFFLGPAATGIYEVAIRALRYTKYVGRAIKRPLLVSVSQDAQTTTEAMRTLNRTGGYAGFASLLAIPLAVFYGEELLRLIYGPEFGDGAIILIAAGVYYTLLTHSEVLSEFLHGLDRPKPVTASIVTAALARVLVSILLLPAFGLYGIVGAMLCAELLRVSILLYGVFISTAQQYVPTQVGYQLVGLCGAMSVGWVLTAVFPTTLISVSIGVVAVAAVYLVIVGLLDVVVRQTVHSTLSTTASYVSRR